MLLARSADASVAKLDPVLIAGGVGALALIGLQRAKPSGAPPGETKGDRWRGEPWPPPGIPTFARRPTARGSAVDLVKSAAFKWKLGPDFETAMVTLAWHESGARLALPAWSYDNRSKADRPEGRPRVSSWGVFQWIDSLTKHFHGLDHSWQMKISDEVEKSVGVYAEKAMQFGGDPRAVFVWHVSPSALKAQKGRGVLVLEELTDNTYNAVSKYLKDYNNRLKVASV